MKKIFFLILVSLVINCGSGSQSQSLLQEDHEKNPNNNQFNDNESPEGQSPNSTIQSYAIEGKIQKGPFLRGTNIVIRELNNRLEQTGNSFSTQTEDNTGLFRASMELTSPFAEVIATGHYFNEITGELSNSPLTLRAIVNFSESPTVNVNVMTSLTRGRIRELVKNGSAINDAKIKAEQELARFFHFDENTIKDYQTLDISQAGDRNSALLAVSAITQKNHSVAELQEILSDIETDLQNNGTIDQEILKNKIITSSQNIDLNNVRKNLESRYLELDSVASIPSFENFIDNDGDGIINGNKNTRISWKIDRDTISRTKFSNGRTKIPVRLIEKKPEDSITISFSSNRNDDINISPKTLTFTPSNYNQYQNIYISMPHRFGNDRNSKSLILTANSSQQDMDAISHEFILREFNPLSLYSSGFEEQHPRIISDKSPFDIDIRIERRNIPSDEEIQIELSTTSNFIDRIEPSILIFPNDAFSNRHKISRIIPRRSFNTNRSGTVDIIATSPSHPHLEPITFTFDFEDYQEPSSSFSPSFSHISNRFISDFISFDRDTFLASIKNSFDNEGNNKIMRYGPDSVSLFSGNDARDHIDGNNDVATFNRIIQLGKLDENHFYVIDENPHNEEYTIRKINREGHVETIYGESQINFRRYKILSLNENQFYALKIYKENPRGNVDFFIDLEQPENNQILNLIDHENNLDLLDGSIYSLKLDKENNLVILTSKINPDRSYSTKVHYVIIDPNNKKNILSLNLLKEYNHRFYGDLIIDENNHIIIYNKYSGTIEKINIEGEIIETFNNVNHWLNISGISHKNIFLNTDNQICLVSFDSGSNKLILSTLNQNE